MNLLEEDTRFILNQHQILSFILILATMHKNMESEKFDLFGGSWCGFAIGMKNVQGILDSLIHIKVFVICKTSYK